MKLCKKCGCINLNRANLCRTCETPFGEAQTITEEFSNSDLLFYKRAAQYSAIAPFATVGAAFLTLIILKVLPSSWDSGSFISVFLGIALIIQMSSVILGIVSIFVGARKGLALTVCLALFGILASCVVGFFAYGLLMFIRGGGYHC
jgi:hypothetical protein